MRPSEETFMRNSRWINVLVALMVLAGSALVYPAEAQMCGVFGYYYRFWDSPDMQGNCPINRVNVVGEKSFDCDGTYMQWGVQGGCDVDYYSWYCGDCQQEP